MSEEANNLRQLIGRLDARVACLPKIDITDWDSHKRRDAAIRELGRELERDEKARVVLAFPTSSIALASIRSSSTMGLAGALQNWLVAARKKLAAMEGAAS